MIESPLNSYFFKQVYISEWWNSLQILKYLLYYMGYALSTFPKFSTVNMCYFHNKTTNK